MRLPACLAAAAGLAQGAVAAATPPVPVGDGFSLTPIAELRFRYEAVGQDGFARDATALTARARAGIEATMPGGFGMLAEAEATLAPVEDYNSLTNGRTAFPAVPDPQNVELSRLQLHYRRPGLALTAGRQRINLDDQRFVGTVAWRQNEQTFDAVRAEAQPLPALRIDVAYVWSVRTVFGVEAGDLPPGGPVRTSIDGDNLLGQAALTIGTVTARGFAFLIDQDERGRRQFSSQTYGAGVTFGILTTGPARLSLSAGYARQSDWQGNPNDYVADHIRFEANGSISGFVLAAGHERLGAGEGPASFAFQTPLATLHRHNGWADKFLTTPPNGLRDTYASIARTVSGLGPLPDLSLALAFHRFESDRLGLAYGDEWNAQLGFRLNGVALLAKFARYDRNGGADFAGDADTRKFWLQLEWSI